MTKMSKGKWIVIAISSFERDIYEDVGEDYVWVVDSLAAARAKRDDIRAERDVSVRICRAAGSK